MIYVSIQEGYTFVLSIAFDSFINTCKIHNYDLYNKRLIKM